MRNIVLRLDKRAAPFARDTPAQCYRAAIDMAQWADRRQIDVIGLSERHVTRDGFLSAPLRLAGKARGDVGQNGGMKCEHPCPLKRVPAHCR